MELVLVAIPSSLLPLGDTPFPGAVTYLQDFILQHRELIGISRGEIVADFGKSLGHGHPLGLEIPAEEKNWSFSGGPSNNKAKKIRIGEEK